MKMRCLVRSHCRDYKINPPKIDDSEGMCSTSSGLDEYGSCWSRFCRPSRNHVVRDVIRGLLVLVALAIVVTVIFLLCYFLLADIEKKEEEVVDNLIKDFSAVKELNMEKPNINLPIIDLEPLPSPSPPLTEIRLQSLDEYQTAGVIGLANPKFGFKMTPHPEFEKGALEQDGGRVKLIDRIDENEKEPSSTESRTNGDPFRSRPEIISPIVEEPIAGNECVPLRLPMCAGSMPWAMTAFPNFVNNSNRAQLRKSLMYFRSTLVVSHCSPRVIEYTCAVLEPACGPDAVPLPPCKAFCEDIVSTCSSEFTLGNPHNDAFDCRRFPDSNDPNVCVDVVNRASTNETAHPSITADVVSHETTNDPDFSRELTNDVLKVTEVPNSNQPVESLPTGKPPVTSTKRPIEKTSSTTTEKSSTQPPIQTTKDNEIRHETSTQKAVEPVAEITESVFICDHTKFLCDDGSDCLDNSAVCDGIQQCLDNSDELNCTDAELITTQLDLSTSEQVQYESTTEFLPITELNNVDGPRINARKINTNSRRPSLSDMLSGSALVAKPSISTLPLPTTKFNKIRRFSLPESTSTARGKSIISTPRPLRKSSFMSFGPFPFTAKPRVTPIIRQGLTKSPKSTKLSLADLLSTSSSFTPINFPENRMALAPLPNVDYEYDTYDDRLNNQRSLSALLSSSAFSSRRQNRFENQCKEMKCIDGSCIRLSQVNDGVRDCPDGADETNKLTKS